MMRILDWLEKLMTAVDDMVHCMKAYTELYECAVNVCDYGTSPIEYARKIRIRDYITEVLCGTKLRIGTAYSRRYVPCDYAASGVIVFKKGRYVRRRK